MGWLLYSFSIWCFLHKYFGRLMLTTFYKCIFIEKLFRWPYTSTTVLRFRWVFIYSYFHLWVKPGDFSPLCGRRVCCYGELLPSLASCLGNKDPRSQDRAEQLLPKHHHSLRPPQGLGLLESYTEANPPDPLLLLYLQHRALREHQRSSLWDPKGGFTNVLFLGKKIKKIFIKGRKKYIISASFLALI